MQFKNILINDDYKKYLLKEVIDNNLSNFYLIYSKYNIGNLSIAISISQYIHCNNKQLLDSCGNCSSCIKYLNFSHSDIKFSYPFSSNINNKNNIAVYFKKQWNNFLTSNKYLFPLDWFNVILSNNYQKPIISLNECNHIIKNLCKTIINSRYNIYIIWLPEYIEKNDLFILELSKKICKNDIVFLISENIDLIAPTVLSKCFLLEIPNIEFEKFKYYIKQEYNTISDNDINFVYNISNNNNYNPILFLLNKKKYDKIFEKWIFFCYKNDLKNVLICIDNILKYTKNDITRFMNFGIKIIEIAYNTKNTKSKSENYISLYYLGSIINDNIYIYIIQCITEIINDINSNINIRILLINISEKMIKIFNHKQSLL